MINVDEKSTDGMPSVNNLSYWEGIVGDPMYPLEETDSPP